VDERSASTGDQRNADCRFQQHNAAMPKSITIRDVPDDTAAELAARAALTGRSLQEYLRARLVELAQAPDAEVLMAKVRARKHATGGSIDSAKILAYRDADRR
jgi:plasmid stability protein